MSSNQFKSSVLSLPLILTIFLGFSSGLPLLTTLDMLKAWLKDSNVELAAIGFSGLLGLPYTLKFIWAPVFDRYIPPILGRRRGWMVITQIAVMLALVLLANSNPTGSPLFFGLCVLAVTFSSASQDVVLDAHRRDSLPENQLALGSSFFVTGYRLGMIMSGAVALNLAEHFTWPQVYMIMASCMLVGVVATLISPEPHTEDPPPRSLQEAIVAPMKDYFSREGAWLILAFIVFYKLGDVIASTMTIPFYKDIGFSWGQVGNIAKIFGIVSNIVGGIAGGVLIMKLGLYRSLWTFGILQAVGILGFALLTVTGPNLYALAAVISFENFSIGLATAAFVGMMGLLCNKRFSATQYALLTSLSGVPRTILGSSSGLMAQYFGWSNFFFLCFALAIPGMLLLIRVRRFLGDFQDLKS